MGNRQYSGDFQNDALALLESSGLGYKPVAEKLGIPPATLRGWYDRRMGRPKGERHKPKVPAPDSENVAQKLARLELENRELRKRLASVEEDKIILKKAAAFFAKESG